jgi:cytochrome b involved in lipid metabolism
MKTYTKTEVEKHNIVTNGWIIYKKNVYHIPENWICILHPGGPIIANYLGKDITEIFDNVHSGLTLPYEQLKKYKIGKLKN